MLFFALSVESRFCKIWHKIFKYKQNFAAKKHAEVQLYQKQHQQLGNRFH